MNKLQEKIKNIKTFFYSIVGGQFKKAVQKLRNLLTLKNEYQSSNNPQLTKLMETKMSFKELVKEKNELIETIKSLILSST